MPALGALRRLSRQVMHGLVPNQSLALTTEGRRYLAAWLALMLIGLYLQSNLVLLIAGLSAGPLVASVFVSAASLRRLRVGRRTPGFVFAGETLAVDYTLENERRRAAALAIQVQDEVAPTDRGQSQSHRYRPEVTFPRVPGAGRVRLRWEGSIPVRGRYQFGGMEIASRSPFGLLERRLTETRAQSLMVYPRVGVLTRPWQKVLRESSETRRGRRHDRSAQQQEYHGLRDYRPGDSPRWIHWRTTARLGEPMVREFEQQNEQDLAILIDPWLPRSRVTSQQKEVLETVLSFAATLALEACRQRSGRRIALGWTGPTPGVIHGPASVKLLHELLTQLALTRGSPEGSMASLLDTMPPNLLRDGLLLVVSTRRVNLIEEAENSNRLRGGATRGVLARAVNLDASRGDLQAYFELSGGLSFGSSIIEVPRSDSAEVGT